MRITRLATHSMEAADARGDGSERLVVTSALRELTGWSVQRPANAKTPTATTFPVNATAIPGGWDHCKHNKKAS